MATRKSEKYCNSIASITCRDGDSVALKSFAMRLKKLTSSPHSLVIRPCILGQNMLCLKGAANLSSCIDAGACLVQTFAHYHALTIKINSLLEN